jgi:hypothetical protein
MSIEIRGKGTSETITVMRIIKGELSNWGYETDEIIEAGDEWGDQIFKLEVKSNGQATNQRTK